MTRELLNKVAKSKKIDLKMYDHVTAFVNEKYTKVHIRFWTLEIINGHRRELYNTYIKLSVMAILKRGEQPEDYETNINGEWIYNIK